MRYKLKVYSIWEFGQRKDAAGNPHQEDSVYPAHGKATDGDRTFILCDGMGGHDAGEVASAAVCGAMSRSIVCVGSDAEGAFTDDDFSRALTAAYDALDAKDSGAVKKMGTTMTFLKLHREGATIAHIGDSRVYHIRPGATETDTLILHQTSDHSLVNDMVKIGEMSKEEARHSSQKNVITRAMQPNGQRPKADIYHTSDIRPGDYFYLCSDGMLEQDEMEDGTVLKRIFSAQVDSDEKRVSILRGATHHNHDNHSAIIVHILDVTGDEVASPKASKPASPKAPRRKGCARGVFLFLLILIALIVAYWVRSFVM
jgi:protein phosphatase